MQTEQSISLPAPRKQTVEWWSCKRLLSHTSAIIYMAEGARGCGKTYAFMSECIDYCLKNDAEFIYLRRTLNELKLNKEEVFGDMRRKYSDYDFKITAKHCLISEKDQNEWNILCHFIALSEVAKRKGSAFPKVKIILFDEYIIEYAGGQFDNYLPHEYERLLSIMETAFRLKDGCRLFMVANTDSIVSPYFKLGVRREIGRRFCFSPDKLVVLESVDAREYRKYKAQTKFARLIGGSDYGRFMLDNTSRDKADYIGKPATHMRTFFYFILMGQLYHFMRGENVFFVKHVKSCGKDDLIINFDSDILREGTRLGSKRVQGLGKQLRMARNANALYYDNQLTKAACAFFA